MPSQLTSNDPHTPQPNAAQSQPHGHGESQANATPASTTTQPPAAQGGNHGLLIGILVVAAFVVILNETTLTVALPVLMEDFKISPEAAQWLTTSFMVTMAVVIPTTGWIMQRFSLRSIYIFALLTFLAGTILAAASPTFAVLLVARIIQATGTALVIPLLMTTIMRLIPVERRGGVMGLVSVVIAVAPAIGPTFSGFVLEHLTWHWTFILMIPLVVIALLIGVWQVKNFEVPSRPSLDILSVILSAVGFAGLIYGVVGLASLAEGIPWDRVAILVVAIAVLTVFFTRQNKLAKSQQATLAQQDASGVARDAGADEKIPAPLLNLEPLRSREYILSLALMLLSFSMLFGFIILMPLYGQNVLGMSEFETGLVSLPGGLLMGVLGPIVGRIYDAKGVRILIIPGSILLALSMAGFATLTPDSTAWHLTAYAVLLNLGIAFMMTPLMSNALAAVPNHLASHGQAILNTFQQIAGGAGTAIFIAIMTYASTNYAKRGYTDPVTILDHGIHVAFMFGLIISIIPIVFSIFVKFDVLRDKKPEKAAAAK
ncbi:multidrug efflux MFS transporter [Corynebacterium sp. DSM 45110]|uniref:Multidrug efflux MFS transporter n=1 Tax=Corynebacterium suicordis DSM 45110 TaxID=1121369 RepID=A0ABR9ZI17_9CORY|nr:multidrug efflux MFS transporter [Corynebacterium suicordis DSM 45110]